MATHTSERRRELRKGAGMRVPIAVLPASGKSRRAKGAFDREEVALIRDRLARVRHETGVLEIPLANLEAGPLTEQSGSQPKGPATKVARWPNDLCQTCTFVWLTPDQFSQLYESEDVVRFLPELRRTLCYEDLAANCREYPWN